MPVKKAIMYGAGNIGRGFIGALFSQSGYRVTFIDVSADLVERMNHQKQYPVRIVSDQGHTDQVISPVDAIDGHDIDAVAEAISEADILATAVGVHILPAIVPYLAAGLRLRFSRTNQPINIILCENLITADKLLKEGLKAALNESEQILLAERVGLVKASVGRMVPVQTLQMQDQEPLRVCVEAYDFLPVDASAFKGPIPDIHNMIAVEPFDFYSERKLYIHNMGHAVCAYLGDYRGVQTIGQSIDDPDTLIIVQNAMQESAAALSCKYTVNTALLLNHIQDLLSRFANHALQDTCQRVGADPARKLSHQDRLIGPALLCLEQNIPPIHICVGLAAAARRYLQEQQLPFEPEKLQTVLQQISGLTAESPLIPITLEIFEQLTAKITISELRILASQMAAKYRKATY